MVLQLGHSSLVNSLAFSPDGETLATAGEDRTIKFWSPQTGELKRTLDQHSQPVRSLAFSPDGRFLASDSGDRDGSGGQGELLLWDAHQGTLLRTLLQRREPSGSSLGGLAFSADGRTLAVAVSDRYAKKGLITLWDVASGAFKRTLAAQRQEIQAMALGTNATLLTSAGKEGTVKVWDVTTGRLRQTLKGEGKPVIAFALARDGKTVAGASLTAGEMVAVTTILLWDAASGKVKRRLVQGGIVPSLSFLPDGRTLVSSGGMLGGGEVKFWDVATGRETRTVQGRSAYLPFVALTPDGRKMATSGLSEIIKGQVPWYSSDSVSDIQIWDVARGKVERTMRGYNQPVTQLAFSPTVDQFVSVNAGGWERKAGDSSSAEPISRDLKVWDARTGRLRLAMQGHGPIAFSGDGQVLAAADAVPVAKATRVRDARGQGRIMQDSDHLDVISLREAQSGRLLRTIKEAPNGAPTALALSPDGRMLAAQGYGTASADDPFSASEHGVIRLWESATGKLRHTIACVAGHSVAFSPDGRLVANGGKVAGSEAYSEVGAIQLWDAQSGKLRRTLKVGGKQVSAPILQSDEVGALAFSPDGKVIVGRGTFGLFWWDVQSGALQRSIETTAYIGDGLSQTEQARTPLAFSPDGTLLATETMEETVMIWDARTGALKHELKGHRGAVLALAFAPGGKYLWSGGLDSTLKAWDVASGQLLVTEMILASSQARDGGLTTDWIAYTPTGFYDGSAGVGRFLRWRVGEALLPAAKFEQDFHRPDLVMKALQGGQ